MNKRGQGMPGGKSTFIPKFIGLLLILSSLSFLIIGITNIIFKIGLLVLGVGLFFWFSRKNQYGEKNRLGQIISVLIFVIGFLLIWFSDFLAPITKLSDFLAEGSIYPFLLLVCSVLLFILGGGLHKILGVVLFLISLTSISEFLINISSIFSFLSFLSKYSESINSVTLNIVILVIGIICLFGSQRVGGWTAKGFGAGKGLITDYKNKDINRAYSEAQAENRRRDVEAARKRAQEIERRT